MDDVAETALLERAREAASTGDWPRAYGLLSRRTRAPGFRSTTSGCWPRSPTPQAIST